MRAKLSARWTDLQSSLWFVPAIATILAALLAIAAVELDHQLWEDGTMRDVPLVFDAQADGARGVLTAIAGSLITVTATVFSITIVALQLASSQFTPRLLRRFTADRGVQVVLAIFFGTFTYALLVLRSVRSDANGVEPFVPTVATSIAILLALTSVGALIFFVHHVARSIQASVLIERAASDALKLVDDLFPAEMREGVGQLDVAVHMPTQPAARILAERGGYLQAIDEATLIDAVTDGARTVRVEARIGDYVLPGALLASIWPKHAVADDLEQRVQRAFVFGFERTHFKDIDYAIRQLADIGVKALSPGINDPTTATICIDRLAEVLTVIGIRRRTANLQHVERGGTVIILPLHSYADLVDVAFTQIRHYGAEDPIVAEHLVRSCSAIAALVPEWHRDPLQRQADLVVAQFRESAMSPADIARVERALRQYAP